VPAGKWDWFRAQLVRQWMVGFSPHTGFPSEWSLAPEDVLGLIFWTRDPSALVRDAVLLQPYRLVAHVTVTDWHEVEEGVPPAAEGLDNLRQAVDTFGPENVVWRFSPVPMVTDVVERFERLVKSAYASGLRSVYLSFLQDNDLLLEGRDPDERRKVLWLLAQACPADFEVRLCQENRTSLGLRRGDAPQLLNLRRGVCEDGRRFCPPAAPAKTSPVESCGCALSVDPFTINEGCKFRCKYCYAAQQELDPMEGQGVKNLPVIP